ncbi:Protein ELYS like [Actinidia chinensis var. chinensis]|uniref:Uncharacterized protein n=2 Tax=Actinidia TaxID=3624 RepID=A0A7J0G9Y9_9ERIC|nr:Protein ELYS like [Actinidia chinensis var. chinensis]GFZ07635.1 hypothetical protein Acr_19g0005720 [Actinidia rufa]
MGDPYEKAKGGRLTFKGSGVATLSKSIDKKKNKKRRDKHKSSSEFLPEVEAAEAAVEEASSAAAGGGEGSVGGGDIYTIDAAKRMKYDQLFPVEAKKFGYDPKSIVRSVEDALDDRVKKKADRYCK